MSRPGGMRNAERVDMSDDKTLDPGTLRLCRDTRRDRVHLTILEDRSYPTVKVVRAFPLSHPDRYITFLDVKNEEIGTLETLEGVEPESKGIVERELARRYLSCEIRKIHAVRSEYGTSYWDVETNRGRREFVVQEVEENAIWLGDHHVVIVDVNDNRFEIPDYTRLDSSSMAFLQIVL